MKKLLLATALFFGVSSAHAGLLIEPYLGYHMGKAKGTPDVNTKGLTYGGRLGYQVLGLGVALDYMTGKMTSDTTPSSDVTPADLGLFVGFTFPILLRVYGVYDFQAKSDNSSSATTFKLEGSAMRLGVGFTALPLLNVGLEYRSATYTKMDGNSLSTNAQVDTYGLVVSLPFDL